MAITYDPVAEVVEAEALGIPPEQLVAMGKPQTNIDGLGLTYQIPERDQESWRPAWRLEIGWDGLEYGKPMKLPKNPNALAIYLAKRRIDGGRLFTLAMPERILGPGQFQCFVAPEFCVKRCRTKAHLIEHMEDKHPRESLNYAAHIKQIRDSIAAENPVLTELVAKIAATPDGHSTVEVPAEVRGAHDVNVPHIPEVTPTTFSVGYACAVEGCGWTPKPGGAKPSFALTLHTLNKHKDRIE